MKALTLHQPWASLIALGVKTIETRSWSTKYRGPLAIHAGKSKQAWRPDCEDSMDRPYSTVIVDLMRAMGKTSYGDVPYGPFGALVATCELVDVAPMGGPYSFRTGFFEGDEGDFPGQHVFVIHHDGTLILSTPDTRSVDVTGQKPFGHFREGRYAWILEDIQPTTERCPVCMGGKREPDPEGRKSFGYMVDWRPCSLCNGDGKCDPVPARGHQGLWEWTP